MLRFKNNAGTVLAQTYLKGTGIAPAVAIYNKDSVPKATVLDQSSFVGIALDGAGDLFTADPSNNRVVELSAGGAVSSVGAGLLSPQSVAVDAGGNLYIADSGNNRVVEVAAGTSTQTTVGTGLVNPTAVTADIYGNVYIGSSGGGAGSVVEVTADGSQTSVDVTGLGSVAGLAVDWYRNLYIADSTKQQVVKVQSAGGQTTVGGGWGAPSGVFIDGQDNLWLTDAGNDTVQENGGQTVGSGWSSPQGVGVDASGHVFVADTGDAQVVEVPGSSASLLRTPLTFIAAPVGQTSTDSPRSVTLQNIGSGPLTGFYYMLGVGPASFQQVAGDGTLPDCTPSLSVAPGASCNMTIRFTPQVEGTISSGIGFADNALTGNGFQTVVLQGVGGLPSITWPAASPITYGQTLGSSTLSGGASSVPGSFAFTSAATAPQAGTQPESVTFTPSNTTEYSAQSVTVNVVVNQAPTLIVANPTATSLTYGQTLASSTLSGGTAISAVTNATVPGSFAFTAPTTQPPGGASSQSVSFTPSDSSDYLPATTSVTVQTAETPVAAPTFSPAPGAYSTAQSVTILDSTSGATIYYTTDGSIPTTSSARYNSANPINVSVNTTIKALAVLSGFKNTTAWATYTMRVPAPSFSEPGGSYLTPQSASISDITSGAALWYTTDGSTPVPGQGTAVQYTGTPVTASQTTTIKAVAAVTGWANSYVASVTYTLKVAAPSFGEPGGSYLTPQSVSISDITSGAAIWYTTDGSTPIPGQGTAVQYTGTPVAVSQTTTIKAVAAITGWANSNVASAVYTIH